MFSGFEFYFEVMHYAVSKNRISAFYLSFLFSFIRIKNTCILSHSDVHWIRVREFHSLEFEILFFLMVNDFRCHRLIFFSRMPLQFNQSDYSCRYIMHFVIISSHAKRTYIQYTRRINIFNDEL